MGASGTATQPLPAVLGSQGLWLLVLFPSGLPTLSLFNAGFSETGLPLMSAYCLQAVLASPRCQLLPPHWHLPYVEPSFRSGSSCPAVTLPGLHALNNHLHSPTVPGKSSCLVSKFREWSYNLSSPLS